MTKITPEWLIQALRSTGKLPTEDDVWNAAIEAAAKVVDDCTMKYINKDHQNAESWIKAKASAQVRALKRKNNA
jgi:hypothetical protein